MGWTRWTLLSDALGSRPWYYYAKVFTNDISVYVFYIHKATSPPSPIIAQNTLQMPLTYYHTQTEKFPNYTYNTPCFKGSLAGKHIGLFCVRKNSLDVRHSVGGENY